MSNNLPTEQNQAPQNIKKNLIVYSVIAVFFCVALLNVYSFFQAKRQEVLAKEARISAQIEADRLARAKAQQQAEMRHQRELQEQELAKQKVEAELLEQKVENQKRLEQYHLLKQARKSTQEDKRLQRRIEHARKHKYIPEGLPKKMVDGIHSATYLTIRNNSKDYIGNYQPNSILKADKLTKGGANGLMLFAMVSDDKKAIQEIIDIGHDINTQNKSGYSSLMFAGAYNSSHIVTFLIESGADTKAMEYITQGNALHVTARFNPHPDVIETMAQAGFDLEAQDGNGNTALLVASKHNQNLEVVERLIELGANTEATDSAGKSAYSYAYERMNQTVPMGQYEFISREYQESVLNSLKKY